MKLSSGFAWKIATREIAGAKSKFAFVLLSVAIGVAALTGVRSLSASFRQTLLSDARTIMAADISARMEEPPSATEQVQMDALAKEGIQSTQVTETLAMASAANDGLPVLVAVKAVDPAKYPFYGSVTLEPAMPLSGALSNGGVAVAQGFLDRTHEQIGDAVRLGGGTFHIAAVIADEPDRLSGSMGIGLRVLISQSSLATTQLGSEGSRATRRYLFKLQHQNDAEVDAARKQLEAALPEALITDYRESSPALTNGLDRATDLLSLMSLVAMVLGAIGVGMAMRAHLQQRLESIAIMKSLGASSRRIMGVYLLQTLLLGLGGGLLGVMLGLGVQVALPRVMARLVHIAPGFHLEPVAIVIGLATGVLTTLLFTLPPLLEIRSARPASIFRHAVEEPEEKGAGAWVQRHRAQLLAAVIIFAGLAAIATALSDSALVGKWFAAGLAATFITLLGAAAGLLKALRALLQRARLWLPQAARQGLANLYRPGNQTAAVLAALGTGVMLVTSVYLLQHAIVSDMKLGTAGNLPNVFLIDIAPNQVDDMRALLKAQPGVRGEPEILPVVMAHVVSIDGVPLKEAKLKNMPRRMLQAAELSWSDTLPPGTRVLQGSWWQPGETAAQVAIGPKQAERMGVSVGSHIVFAVQDERIDAVVSAIIRSDGQHGMSRVPFILPKSALQGLPAMWFGGVHVDTQQVGALQNALYRAFPGVAVIDVAAAMETVRTLVLEITRVVQFLAAFSIFAGAVVLASSVAGTRYRRLREIVVLKTLGATRARIAAIFSVEFAVLGAMAGSIGVVFAMLLTWVLLPKMEIDFHPQWGAYAVAIAATILLANGTGWIASYRLLGQKPLQVLREE